MSLTLTVHRGTHEIGGTCIEIHHTSGERLILDAGRPLDAPEGANGLVPVSLDCSRPATVLISHPHQDHWGVIDQLPASWPIWTGSKSAKLIAIPGELFRRPLTRTFMTWDSRSGRFDIGPFRVTPILTDHSAYDAYMLLIEADGRRILYTGDFRRHGRKSVLVDRMMANPPGDIDVLFLEGTNLGSDKPVKSERDLEQDFLALFNRTKGRVFVTWSGQNMMQDYERAGVVPNSDDAYNFSMWKCYLEDPYHSEALKWCQYAGGEIAYIHTSGHAAAADLRAFAAALQSKVVIPVHGNRWDENSECFANVKRLCDSEEYVIS